MTPGEIIAELDEALAEVGEQIKVRRFTGSGTPRTFQEASISAVVRVKKAEDLTANQDQATLDAILSPTGISFLPLRKGDVIVRASGSVHNIELVKPIVIGTTIVRIELDVKG